MSVYHPFANQNFLSILEKSKSVGEQTGWIANHIQCENALLPSYVKLHSYGEYIFDWAWAQFYEANGLDYYPKLIHAIAFTPVNAPKTIGDQHRFKELAHKSYEFYMNSNLSSEHYLFINDHEQMVLENLGFATKLTHQYHFYNEYESFEHFLSCLRKNKRKNIVRERRAIANSDLEIKTFIGNEITDGMLEDFYLFYISTTSKKGAYSYLTKDFFISLEKDDLLIIAAYKKDKVIAMSLFFRGSQTLYGRYWGVLPECEEIYPFLHFELCYYQGIEFCIENKMSLFEAGAQGEHKLLRGFRPVIIKSAHHVKIPQCFEIIKKDIESNNQQVLQDIKYLNNYLPFKKE